jgi:hypothetical protein
LGGWSSASSYKQIPASQLVPAGQAPSAAQVPEQQTPSWLPWQGPMPQDKQQMFVAQLSWTWQLEPLPAAHAVAATRRPSAAKRSQPIGRE